MFEWSVRSYIILVESIFIIVFYFCLNVRSVGFYLINFTFEFFVSHFWNTIISLNTRIMRSCIKRTKTLKTHTKNRFSNANCFQFNLIILLKVLHVIIHFLLLLLLSLQSRGSGRARISVAVLQANFMILSLRSFYYMHTNTFAHKQAHN